mgnify:CR=1 FL=1
MIDWISDRLAWKVKSMNSEETASVELLSYFFAFTLTNLLVIVITISFGIAFDTLKGTIVGMAGFALLRAVSGGYHIKSADLCVLLSSAMIILIPFIPLKNWHIYLLTVISLFLAVLYAPSKISNQTNIPEKFHKHLKVISLAIIASNFFILSSVLALAFFIQSLLLIRRI